MAAMSSPEAPLLMASRNSRMKLTLSGRYPAPSMRRRLLGGGAIVALIALNILSRLDLDRYGPDSVERRHCEIEAMKLAWVIRNRHVAEVMNTTAGELLPNELVQELGDVDPRKYLHLHLLSA